MPVEDGEWYDDDPSTSPSIGEPDPIPPGPELLSDAPTHPTEPLQGVGDAEAEAPPEFDPRWREDFEGLLYLGRLNREFEWLGHSFVIRTLNVGETLEVGQIHKEYVGTLAEGKAYQAAVVAACVVSVDGRPLSVPLTSETADTPFRNRFQYVLRSWFPPVLDKVYEEYLLLEERVAGTLDAMGKVRG